jgi:phosphoribosylformimino-5-aminoimidazole carboxamide ribotide isomerase
MILLPAIDLFGGEVVRLSQGKADQKTVYSRDPVAFARQWEAEGGNYLHLVDLDAAFTGTMANLGLVRAIAHAVSIPCELGGGIRTHAAVEAAITAGASRVVLGTRAAESLDFVAEMAGAFGSDKIAVGVDAKDGMVALRGWTESSGLSALDLAKRAEDAGAGTIIYTDIATDGMLCGPNFAGVQAMLESVGCRVIASGGVGTKAHIARLLELPGLYGCIIGRALYEKTVSLPELAAMTRNTLESGRDLSLPTTPKTP